MALFGERLREYLSREGMTQQELADCLDYSRQQVGKWVNKKNPIDPPTRDVITAIGDCLSLTVQEIDALLVSAGHAPLHTSETSVQAVDELTAGTLRVERLILKQNTPSSPEPPPLTIAEEIYLRTLRAECDRLPLVEDERSSPTARKADQPRASLANVYIDLDTIADPDFGRVCERLRIPATQRQAVQQALVRVAPEVLPDQQGERRRDELAVLHALVGRSATTGGEPEALAKTLKKWVKDEETLRRALRPITAVEALAETPHLVLLGDPGSGKSTFVNHLAFLLAGALLGEQPDWAEMLETRFMQPLFPLRIVARRWSGSLNEGDAPGIERVYSALAALPGGMERDELLLRLRQPNTLVLFDGLDEAPVAEYEGAYDRRRVLLDTVEAFIVAHPKCRVLVTSRIRPYQTPGYQLGGTKTATLAKLDAPRMERFVRLWYNEVQRVEGMTDARATELTEDLLAAIDRRSELYEMAEIPLLLTMLALVNNRYGLPENRAELYDQCTEQLLWEWEQVKAEEGKTQSLDHLLGAIEPRRSRLDVEKVLWRLTFSAHQLSGKRDADLKTSDLREALALTTPVRSANWMWADRMVKFMQERGGLLTAVDDATFTFPHRSFQEYLAARRLLELPDPGQEALKLAGDDVWHEVILLACGHLAVRGLSSLWGMIVNELAFAIEDDANAWQAVILAGVALLEFGPDKVEGRIGKRLRQDLPPILTTIMQNPDLPAASRLEAGLLAADLGCLPADLDALIPAPGLAYPCRIGKYPVTNAQYQRFIVAGGYNLDRPWWTKEVVADIERWSSNEDWRNGPRYRDNPTLNKATQPVVGVSWYEAAAYCQWLTEELRKGNYELRDNRLQPGDPISPSAIDNSQWQVRLPTVAEWGAAAGTGRRAYAWEGDFDPKRCNSKESGFGQSSPVHMYPAGATPEGVYDLCGNVWEWSDDDDPTWGKKLRGGAWWTDAEGVTSASPGRDVPGDRDDFVGLRVVVVPSSRVS